MSQVSAIYQAESPTQARTRLAAFVDAWQVRTPKTVETLQRDCEQTITYFRLEGMTRELVRTTSLLERTNREMRRKFRQVCCFGSPKGAEGAVFLRSSGLNARWSTQTWWQTSQLLYLDFLTLHP